MRIFIFGDSITQGFFDTKGGWVGRLASDYHQLTLKNMLADKPGYYEIYNLGVSGDNTVGVAERIDAEVQARRLYKDQDVIVLSVGINDSILRDNQAQLEVYNFQESFEQLLDKAKALTPNVVCLGLTAVDEAQTNPWPFSSDGEQFKNNRINLFEDTIKQSAIRYDMPFVPVHDQFLAALNKDRNLLADGLHPNDKGHQLVYETVKPVLDELLQA